MPLERGKGAEGIQENTNKSSLKGLESQCCRSKEQKDWKLNICHCGISVTEDPMRVKGSKCEARVPFDLYSLSYQYHFSSPLWISTLIATRLARCTHTVCQLWPPECNGWKPDSQTDRDFQQLALHTKLAVPGSFNNGH